MPGQSISVNKYTVQVERYLSQGGFAHVYLVRTPTPVYNTTHHVLKRIAVANEAMLSEVKKEVDIMRLLKGHPNIVHLIDAAWHKMPNGMFEVFILMEYCPGGGIIDMMNRRLRERLTEAEILQIFVDVCEGVAFMHNSRPPLLHRDLKVENILHSSPTSYKLCDFGSATTVTRPPTSMQDIRALEADLNRHTTLQYRAPEMVDVYSKRPVDEKSDVWALGVLLYKLCYYTTPFEEHGPLAILNVQYRIPPYPVYSNQMNMLIASILREHGSQRPTVFELLSTVHQLRGTKSRYQYTVATSQPLPQQHIPPKPVDSVISYSTGPRTTATPPSLISNSDMLQKNQGVQARERVLEAIAPMRRGRPANLTESRDSSSRPSSPKKSSAVPKPGLDLSNPWMADENKAWQTVTNGSNFNGRVGSLDSAWNVGGTQQQAAQGPKEPTGFGDDFAEKLWRSSDPNIVLPPPSKVSPVPSPSSVNQLRSQAAPIRHVAHTGNDIIRRDREKDAFDGLGLSVASEKPAPTLGEARKLRTGLAIMSTNMVTPQSYNRNDEKQSTNSIRPSASPRPPYLTPQPPQQRTSSPAPSIASNSSSSWRNASFPSSGPNTPTASRPDGLPTESRFPSLEELDAQFSPNSMYPAAARSADSRYATHHLVVRSNDKPPQLPPRPAEKKSVTVNTEQLGIPRLPYGRDGVRSEQVTGVAMRDAEGGRRKDSDVIDRRLREKEPEIKTEDLQAPSEMLRPVLQRKHRSSVSIKQTFDPNNPAESSKATKVPASSSNVTHASRRIPVPALPRDWLTGDDDEQQNYTVQTAEQKTVAVPVLRDSPSKRASLIERSDLNIQDPAVAQHDTTSAPAAPEPVAPQVSPTISRFTKSFPLIDTSYPQEVTSNQSRSPVATPALKEKEPESSSSADEGPEEPSRLISAAGNTARSNRTRRKGRQSSVHDLVDLWGGGVNAREKAQVKVSPQSTLPSDYRPAKTRPSTLLSPPTQLLTNTRSSPSPERLSPSRPSPSPTSTRQPSMKNGPVRQPTSGDAATPSGSKRPQSMFIFPSKSTDGASSPEEPRPRLNVRRTSISDRVQRYEAIGGRASAPRPPSPVSHKLPNIKTTQLIESPRFDSSENPGPGDPVKNRSTSSLPPRQSLAIPRSPVKSRNTHLVEKPETKQEHEKSTLRRPSFKSESLALASSTARKEVFLEENRQGSTEQGRSPSPDRPYQGVGKLIDQWQRKTAEVNAIRPTIGNKAPASIPKRAGTVHGGTDGA